MTTSCPNCGAPIEFRFDDSFVRVCEHCRNAVLRTDRDVSSLGKVADLMPIDSPLKLFAEGHYGSQGFLLVGMAQIRHRAGGIWQEWYAKLDGGTWGWLAEAQGRYYLTFEEHVEALPPYEDFTPGRQVELPVPGGVRMFTVVEATQGAYIAATGELPFKLVPQGTFRYVDLDDGQGTFATIDFSDEDDKPAAYIGSQVALADLGIRGGELGPSREAKISSSRLACPQCNAPIELRAPGESLRVVCASCGTLIALESGVGKIIEQLHDKPVLAIPLGSKCTFADGEMTVIGYVKRSANVEGDWYPFEEYLLHAQGVGFRWLVCSDGNWSYVQPVEVGAVKDEMVTATYEGVQFRNYQGGRLRVDSVLGELYWQVAIGEITIGSDYIAPPAMLSKEATEEEINWSLCTYQTDAQMRAAFGGKNITLRAPTDIAANAPMRWPGVAAILSWGLAALCVLAIAIASMNSSKTVLATSVNIPPGVPPVADGSGATPDSDHVAFTEQFPLVDGKNIRIELRADVNNDWAYTAADLVNVDTGEVTSFDANLEYYHGYEDGESWSEGHPNATQFIGPRRTGMYMLRFESQHGGAGTARIDVTVEQGVMHWSLFAWALVVLGGALVLVGGRVTAYEVKRWANAVSRPSRIPGQYPLVLGCIAAGTGIAILAIGAMT